MRKSVSRVLVAAFTAINLTYLLFPLIAVDPTEHIEVWLSDVKRSSDGLSVDFTVCFKNQGIWPIGLTNMKWRVRIVGGPFSCICQETPSSPFPDRLAVGPMTITRVPAFAMYDVTTAFWIGFERGYRGDERMGSIERIIVSITGSAAFFHIGASKPLAFDKDAWTI